MRNNYGTVRLQADYTITAHMFNDGPNTTLLERPQTNMVNAGIHYIPENSKYEFIAGATNLTATSLWERSTTLRSGGYLQPAARVVRHSACEAVTAAGISRQQHPPRL
jgi:hypothetical protein